jgi:uncharacterized protein YuzE
MPRRIELDPLADAAYVRVTDHPVARTKELDSQRILDYDAQGEIVGLEFLAISQEVDLAGLPYGQELARLFDGHNVSPVYLP